MLPDWLETLRRAEVFDRLMNDPRSVARTALGVDSRDATRLAAGWGHADFDEPWRNLSPDDRVLLYAHYFQRGHLEELLTAFEQLFGVSERPRNPIVVDVGCGPFTGGLAIASLFPRDSQIDYVGIDVSSAMRRLGARLAAAAEMVPELPRIRRHWATDVPSAIWSEAPGWRPVIVIVSYLLESRTLDVAALIPDLDRLLKKLGRGSATVLYTNSIRDEANRNFPKFRTMLRERGFDPHTEDTGEIEVERRQATKTRRFRYALFYRPAQRTLDLG